MRALSFVSREEDRPVASNAAIVEIAVQLRLRRRTTNGPSARPHSVCLDARSGSPSE